MPADASFTELMGFVLRTDELLHDIKDESIPVPRRGFRNRLNAIEVFNDREFLARYCFTTATVTSLLKFLSLEECENSRCLLVPPVPQLLITLQFYGVETFSCMVTHSVSGRWPRRQSPGMAAIWHTLCSDEVADEPRLWLITAGPGASWFGALVASRDGYVRSLKNIIARLMLMNNTSITNCCLENQS
ncbi:hypothetical protein HPB47_021366 [Ixodes persulcatus]|uniref:Uncharacterized protein n=1 Tax=Ixodes persulcatus TaxID=34615 RepID=A0AC60QD10_IXOPE|nr:hypothetical protein HPB47_021366 [Ixodes persulcatus]